MEADILDMESFNQHEAGLGEKEKNAWKGKVGEGWAELGRKEQ